jgi:hypothetical protein
MLANSAHCTVQPAQAEAGQALFCYVACWPKIRPNNSKLALKNKAAGSIGNRMWARQDFSRKGQEGTKLLH